MSLRRTDPKEYKNFSLSFSSSLKISKEKGERNCVVDSVRASSPGRSGGGEGKEMRGCNYVSGI